MSDVEWTAQTVATLRLLWAEGHSTAEIGRRMNISKNAVVGKAHRLNLPPRPSPIRRPAEGAPRKVAAPRMPKKTLSPLCTELEGVSAVVDDVPTKRVWTGPPKPCCWPIGEPGKPSFHFCNAPSVPGRPYCAAHVEIAYVRYGGTREDLA